jgi:hypothetical protein
VGYCWAPFGGRGELKDKEQRGTKHPASEDSEGRKDEYTSYTISYIIYDIKNYIVYDIVYDIQI